MSSFYLESSISKSGPIGNWKIKSNRSWVQFWSDSISKGAKFSYGMNYARKMYNLFKSFMCAKYSAISELDSLIDFGV